MVIIGVYPDSTAWQRLRIREKRRTACLDLQQWHTTSIADILKPTTTWAFRAKLAGQAQGSAQDVEPIPLITSFHLLKISGGEAYLTHTAISRSPLWMLCR